MITPFRYDGHMCQIVETDHDGYVMYDGFVDDEQICRDQPTEAEARHAVVCYVCNKSQNQRMRFHKQTRTRSALCAPSNFRGLMVAIGLGCYALLSSAQAQHRYTVTDLGTLGGNDSDAEALNNKGHVVGMAAPANDNFMHAFLYNGQMHDLGTIGQFSIAYSINNRDEMVGFFSVGFTNRAFLYRAGQMQTLFDFFSFATGINSRGDIVGAYASGQTSTGIHAFVYRRGRLTDLGTLGGDFSEAYGINEQGEVVGYAEYGDQGFSHAFLYREGQMIDLGTLHAPFNQSVATAINERGQIVGYAYGTVMLPQLPYSITGYRAFVYQSGQMHDLGVLKGMFSSAANSINNEGEIVGYSFDANFSLFHAFVYVAGNMYDLNDLAPTPPGWYIANATGINERGQIAATMVYSGQTQSHAVLLTPVDEDESQHLHAFLKSGGKATSPKPGLLEPILAGQDIKVNRHQP
jgi:probable HAF family extracellular repeat protein